VASAACDRLHDVEPAAAPTGIVEARSRSRVRELSLKLAYERGKLERRFNQRLTVPNRRPPKRCPDGDIAEHAKDRASRTLVVRSEDARHEAKNLLPLKLVDQLRSNEFDELEQGFVPATAEDGALRLLGSVTLFEPARAELEMLSKRRYRAEFLVTDYRGPRLIYKLGKNRREWLAGVIATRLLIFEIDKEQALCETMLRAVNDTNQVPTSLRLQESTRSLLIRELGHRLQNEAVAALSRMTNTLSFPEAWPSRTHSSDN
jgi:hypothetical protein